MKGCRRQALVFLSNEPMLLPLAHVDEVSGDRSGAAIAGDTR